MWPPIEQIDGVGSKTELIRHLDSIASEMKTFRPRTKALIPGTQIPNDIVLKRTNSDSGEHVIFPNHPNRNWEYLSRQLEIPGCVWLGQAMVDTLRYFGEWRVIFVDGKIVCIVHTKYQERTGTWKMQGIHDFYSLKELGCVNGKS
jgi:hypothetical protein